MIEMNQPTENMEGVELQATIRWMGYDPSTLSPGSHKKVWTIRSECGMALLRRLRYKHLLCPRCGNNSPEHRRKLSEANSGENHPCYGKHLSEETRRKISEAHTGVPLSKDHCRAISEVRLGKKHSKEHKQNISVANKGKKRSAETRSRMSNAQKGRTFSEPHLRKLSDAHKGILRSEEAKQRHSATLQGISYDEWESFATDSPYCPAFNEACRESNRDKYDRKCFLCGKDEDDNITKTGKHNRLSVHHYDMNKAQGCDGHAWKLVPLCIHHHGKTAHTDTWMARIQYLLNHVWGQPT